MDQQKHTTEDTLTDIFGSKEMRSPAPTEFIPKNKTAPEIAYQQYLSIHNLHTY